MPNNGKDIRMVEKLTKEEIKQALEAIHRLCQFDAETRYIRGYGAFKKEEIPVPVLVKLTKLLQEQIENS